MIEVQLRTIGGLQGSAWNEFDSIRLVIVMAWLRCTLTLWALISMSSRNVVIFIMAIMLENAKSCNNTSIVSYYTMLSL